MSDKLLNVKQACLSINRFIHQLLPSNSYARFTKDLASDDLCLPVTTTKMGHEDFFVEIYILSFIAYLHSFRKSQSNTSALSKNVLGANVFTQAFHGLLELWNFLSCLFSAQISMPLKYI